MYISDSKRKKKILYVITKSNWGGAQRYVYDLATNLPKDKFEAVVAAGGSGMLKDKLGSAGIRYIPIDKLGRDLDIGREFAVFWELLKLFRVEQPDVVHLNSSKIGGLGSLAGCLHNLWGLILYLLQPTTYNLQPTQIIFTAHGWAFQEERPIIERLAIRFFSWMTVMLSSQTIVISDKQYKETPRPFFWGKKIKRIHNGISLSRSKTNTRDKQSLLKSISSKIPLDSVVIGTIAELHRNKGLFYLVEAFREIAKADARCALVIIGDGEERKRLEKKAAESRISKKVVFTGFLENAGRFIPAFNIFILPSVKEGLPYTLIEAGAVSLPVIATSVGGIPDIIDDMKSGVLVRPRQPKELASAIRFLLGNPTKAAEFGRNLEEKVAREFTLERMARETIVLYQ